jgi:predicted Zn finger-like uncharacterized protein
MDLFTLCPQCESVFRVTTRDLQASGGQVRCGRCHAVFDGFAGLTARLPAQPSGGGASDEKRMSAISSAPTDTADDTANVPAAGAASAAGDVAGIAQRPSSGARQAAQQTVKPGTTNLFEWEFKPTPGPRRTWLWTSLSAIMLVGALLQTGYLLRNQLMVNYPQTAPLFQQLCGWLSCETGPPRLAEQLNIDASDLYVLDPNQPQLVKLTALVRNRAPIAVQYPAFELTLTNAQEQVVARRVFFPADYLADPAWESAGLGARRELAVNLFLDTGDLRAAGYQIYLFYPSPT